VTDQRFELWRVMSGAHATIGTLYFTTPARRALCWTLEDHFSAVKVHGMTRIPAGSYALALRTEGGMHARYTARFGDFHRGMIWLQHVPGFEYVYLHCGNTDADTEGCILLGNVATESVSEAGMLGASEAAYRRVYPLLADPLSQGTHVWLQITDLDTPPGAA
jgi:Family of unknown function (DUF5675)